MRTRSSAGLVGVALCVVMSLMTDRLGVVADERVADDLSAGRYPGIALWADEFGRTTRARPACEDVDSWYEVSTPRIAQPSIAEFEQFTGWCASRGATSVSLVGLSGFTTVHAGMLRRIPDLTRVDLSGSSIEQGALATVVRLPGLRHLILDSTGLCARELEPLRLASELRTLDLGNTHADDGTLRSISGLRNLRTLRLPGTRVSDNGTAALLELRSLRSLDLCDTPVGLATANTLRGLPQLNEVRASGCRQFDDEAVRVLLANPSVRSIGVSSCVHASTFFRGDLVDIDLSGVGMNDESIASVVRANPGLVRFRARGTRAGDLTAVALSVLERLRAVDLSVSAHVGDQGCAALARSRSLRDVAVTFPFATSRGLSRLVGISQLRRLRIDVGLTDEALDATAPPAELEELAIGESSVTSRVFKWLGVARSLRSLAISRCPEVREIPEGLAAQVPSLENLDLSGCGVDVGRLAEVISRVPVRVLTLRDIALTDSTLEELSRSPGLEAIHIADRQWADTSPELSCKLRRLFRTPSMCR